MANKAHKPAEVEKKKIFCIRLDETYTTVLQALLVQLRDQLYTDYYNATTVGEQTRLGTQLRIIDTLKGRFTYAMERAEMPERTGIPGIDRVVTAELNRYKRAQNGGLTDTQPVSKPRTRRR